jgi:hypothetical protein
MVKKKKTKKPKFEKPKTKTIRVEYYLVVAASTDEGDLEDQIQDIFDGHDDICLKDVSIDSYGLHLYPVED